MTAIFFDETTSRLTFGSPNYWESWNSYQLRGYVGGTLIKNVPSFSSYLNFMFSGIGVSFYGSDANYNETRYNATLPEVIPTQVFIDNVKFGTPITIVTTMGRWYQSPTLSDGPHNLTLLGLPHVVLDYILVSAGDITPLSGQQLLVDDGDPAISYSGNWFHNTSVVFIDTRPDQVFVGNSSRQTSSLGASATFEFTGTSVSIFGISNSGTDSISVNFTLDDGTPSTHVFSVVSPPNTNLRWFDSSSLAPGDHTLRLEIVAVHSGDCLFTLDYITYSPSFENLATKFATSSIIISPPTSTTTFGNTGTTIGTGTPTESVPAAVRKSHTTDVLIGAIIGSLMFLILTFLVWWIRRRSRTQMKHDQQITRPFGRETPRHTTTEGASAWHFPSTLSDSNIATSNHGSVFDRFNRALGLQRSYHIQPFALANPVVPEYRKENIPRKENSSTHVLDVDADEAQGETASPLPMRQLQDLVRDFQRMIASSMDGRDGGAREQQVRDEHSNTEVLHRAQFYGASLQKPDLFIIRHIGGAAQMSVQVDHHMWVP
ncbi:hypothetical protein DXG01_007327 [Tephrocybe rancida]|nr:hypothetical protein DXG01_007327 [Tephrocybe rancida]